MGATDLGPDIFIQIVYRRKPAFEAVCSGTMRRCVPAVRSRWKLSSSPGNADLRCPMSYNLPAAEAIQGTSGQLSQTSCHMRYT